MNERLPEDRQVPPVVHLRLHDGAHTVSAITLDRLTPAARGLAEAVWLGSTLHGRGVIWVRGPGGDLRPWDGWAHYPPDSAVDPHAYLEKQARKLAGWVVLRPDPRAGAAAWQPGPSDDLLTRQQVIARLRRQGISITPSTWSAYTARGQAPAPGRYVSRTPLWSAAAIDAWTAQRPGRGARTDRRPRSRD